MKKNCILFILSLSVIISFRVSAQKIEFDHITEKDGLTTSSVTSILKDSKGYMWFGTFNGLVRYDGYAFTNFLYNPLKHNSNAVNDNHIWNLLESKDKIMYVVTRMNGFYIYDPKTGSFTKYIHEDSNSNSISDNVILNIFEDSYGNIWLGTNAGLDRFDYKTKTFKHYSPFNKEKKYIAGIAEDKDGNLWLYGASNYVCKFNYFKNISEHIKITDNSELLEVYNQSRIMLRDNADNLWIGNKVDGLYKINLSSKKVDKYSVENGKIKSNNINSITKDSEGNIWIGTDGGGLNKYNRGSNSFQTFQNNPEDPTTISSNAIICVYESEPGIIWIGTYAAGLNVIKSSKAKFLKFEATGESGKRLSQKSVLAFEQGKGDKIWIGTDGGGINLFDLKNKQFTYLNEDNGKICSNVIKSLHSDHLGKLWCGTFRKGVCLLDDNSGKYFSYSSTNIPDKVLRNDNVWAIGETRDGKVWLGLLAGGIAVYDPLTHNISRTSLDVIDNFKESTINKIIVDRKGRIWIATSLLGVICFDHVNDNYTHFKFDNKNKYSLRSNDVRDIFEDSKGNIWVATMEGGLNKLTDFYKQEFHSYTTLDGLSTNIISAILEDDHNNLWLSTNKGISCFKIKENKFLNFDTDDGVQSLEFNDGAKLKTRNGYLLFGGINGFNLFHPDSIRINTLPPPVVITDFKIFNHSFRTDKFYNGKQYLDASLDQVKQIELTDKDLVFSIEFAALNHLASGSCKYAYKLEGFDRDWVYVNSNKRFTTYTNLNPGTYTFRVIASNDDGIWNKEGASLRIIILPPWYMTWWFKVLIFVLVISGFVAFNYLRSRSIKLRNQYLEEEVKKQTEVLMEMNASLQERNDEVTLKNEILEYKNIEITQKTDRILQQQEEILLQKDELEQLNKTKDKLFSIIAHDLKNPVNALTWLTNTAKKEIPDHSGLITNIENSALGIKKLLSNLLEWAKTQTGNIKVDKQKISLEKIIQDGVDLHIQQAYQKKIFIKAEIDPSYYILGDYNMISTVARNIISNNIKYTNEFGRVNITASLNEGNNICIKFKDNGIGMSEELISKLFNPQHKIVSNKGTSNETGTGLGLFISHEFTELNNGKINVESQEGEGTTFTLILPGGIETDAIEDLLDSNEFSDRDKESEFIEINIHYKFKGKRVLIVEDDDNVRLSLKKILSDSFEVIEASDPSNANLVLGEILPDLIISDINMPVETGITFCQSIKKNRNTSHIPLILVTGENSNKVQLEGLVAGADAYIPKPVDKNILFTTINNLLNSLENIKRRFSNDTELILSEFAHNGVDEELLTKAIKFIDKNISNSNLNGDTLCKELAISKSVLYNKLKILTGQTVNEFIRTIRLKKSIVLLMEGKLNISQVATEMGFNSLSYFTKSFTSHFGVSPKEYLSKNKNSKKINA